MASSLFISYCRREAAFADSLVDNLEDRGYPVWLDYHSLVPGRSWAEQIEQGLVEAEVVLLVVSKEAMASPYVQQEWRRAVDLKKRLILIIFEAVKLPAELVSYEWIDFRTSFNKGLKELLGRLDSPLKPEQPPPQTGFKAPRVVWVSAGLSLVVAVLTIPTWWTLYFPYYLWPLPYRILKRDFNYFHVQSALVMLPLVIFFGYALTAASDSEVSDTTLFTFLGSLILAPLLFFLLRSTGIQRWGKPIASRPQFANLYNPKIDRPRPVSFTLDYAPEDKKYAEEIIKTLTQYGHAYDEPGHQAEVAFVLLSAFKNSSVHNPEERVIYPIILQTVPKIDDKLQRIQWIDFRRGLSRLKVMPQLLPEPARLLKALGVTPASNQQLVLPPIIQTLVYFLTLTAIFTIGGWLVFLFRARAELSVGEVSEILIVLGLFLGLIFVSTRALIRRSGKLASLPYFSGIIALLGLLVFVQAGTAGSAISEESIDNFLGNSTLSGLWTCFLGSLIVGPLTLWRWPDLRRWFPQR